MSVRSFAASWAVMEARRNQKSASARPAQQHGRDLLPVRLQQGAETVGHSVHEVPGRAAADDLRIDGQHRQVPGHQPQTREVDRRIAFLAVFRLAPQLEYCCPQFVGGRKRIGGSGGLHGAPHLRHPDAQGRHGGLHVRLRARTAGWIGTGMQRGADSGQDILVHHAANIAAPANGGFSWGRGPGQEHPGPCRPVVLERAGS